MPGVVRVIIAAGGAGGGGSIADRAGRAARRAFARPPIRSGDGGGARAGTRPQVVWPMSSQVQGPLEYVMASRPVIDRTTRKVSAGCPSSASVVAPNHT